jgi:hypothetical protein
MGMFVFEAENLGQFNRVIEGLKSLDTNILVKEKNEITPFESDMRVKIQLEASYEQVLKNLAEIKNSKTPLDTIRPLQ